MTQNRKINTTRMFSAAHFLVGHKKCGRLHGHNYNVSVTIATEEMDYDMIMDFGDISRVIDKLDHRLLVNRHDVTLVDPEMGVTIIVWDSRRTNQLEIEHDSIYVLDGMPTAETIAKHLAYEIIRNVWCAADVTVRVNETDDSYAEHSVNNYTEGDELESSW